MVQAGELSAQAQLDYAQWDASLKHMLSQVDATMKQISAVTQQAGKAVQQKMTAPLQKFGREAGHIFPTVRGYIKDFSRVATGILLSQLFYRAIVFPITSAIKELWEFNNLLERTEVSLKYLLIDIKDLTADTSAMADEMIKNLEVLAARTPYTLQTAIEANQTLLALGFTKEQLMPLLTLMADLSAATGGQADQMQKLAWALGRVQQQGRMTRRELRLFVSARVPIMKILEEQLGITEFPNLFSIPANVAVPAILQGIMKFKGAAKEMEGTMSGLLSSIHDYLLFIGRDIFEGLFTNIRKHLKAFREELASLWEVFDKFGLEGLISKLFGVTDKITNKIVGKVPEWVAAYQGFGEVTEGLGLSVWQLVNILREFGKAIANIWRITAPFRKELANLALILIGWVSRGFLIITKIIQAVTGVTMKATSVVRIMAAALIGLAVASTVSKLLGYLIGMFQGIFMSGFGVVRILGLIVGLLMALALAIPSVQKWFSNLGDRILRAFGIQIPQSIMVTKAAIQGLNTDAIDNIDWQKLIDSFSDTEDAAGSAADAINDKFLASFDEVYQIPEKLGEVGGGLNLEGLGDLGDLDFGLPEDVDLGLGNMENALGEFKINWENVWNLIKNIAVNVWDTILLTGRKIFETLPTLLAPIAETVVTLIVALMQTIIVILPKMMTTSGLLINALLNSIITFGLDKITKFGWEMFKIFTRQFGSMGMLLGALGARLGYSLAISLKNTVLDNLAPLGISIIETILRPLSKLEGFWGTMFKPVVDPLLRYLDNAKKWFEEGTKAHEDYNIQESYLWKGTQIIIDAASKDFVDAYADLGTLLTTTTSDFIETTKPIWQQFGDDVKLVWSGTIEELKDIWGPGLDNIKNTWIEWVDSYGRPIWSGYGRDLEGIWGDTWDNINTLVNESTTELYRDYEGKWRPYQTSYEQNLSGLEVATQTSMNNIKETIIANTDAIVAPVTASAEEASKAYTQSWNTEINTNLKTEFESIADLLVVQKDEIANVAKVIAEAATGKMSEVFKRFKPTVGIAIKIPDIKIPGGITGQTIKGFTIDAPKVAQGGIFMRETLAHLSEGNKPETVTPLTEKGIEPWAKAIVSQMNLGGNRTTPIDTQYVLVPLDRMDYTNLERNLYKIRRKESTRIAGRG